MMLTIFLVLAALSVLIWRYPVVRGTTLVGPWIWSTVALLGMSTWLLAADSLDEDSRAAWRLVAAALTLCPGMSLLGAKRPQDQAWHFIVASLWLVVSLPAIQNRLFDQGGELDLHAARSWFLLILVMMGILNSGWSRFSWAVLLAGWGQLILLAPFLPQSMRSSFAVDAAWGLAMYAAAPVLAVVCGRRKSKRLVPMNAAWRDFRDAFGVLWAVRVIERVNTTSRSNQWPVMLGWQGFYCIDGTPLAEYLAGNPVHPWRQNLKNLLRRFVSEAWLERRLERT